MDDDKLTIGFIIAVHGGQAMIALSQFHHQFGSGGGESTSDERARIGSLLKVRSRDATVYGVVTRLATDVEPGPEGPVERNIADIDLLGEVMDSSGDNPVFERGVSVMPNLGPRSWRRHMTISRWFTPNRHHTMCPSSKQMGLLSVFHKGGSGSSLFDVKPLGVDGSSGGFGWSVF